MAVNQENCVALSRGLLRSGTCPNPSPWVKFIVLAGRTDPCARPCCPPGPAQEVLRWPRPEGAACAQAWGRHLQSFALEARLPGVATKCGWVRDLAAFSCGVSWDSSGRRAAADRSEWLCRVLCSGAALLTEGLRARVGRPALLFGVGSGAGSISLTLSP